MAKVPSPCVDVCKFKREGHCIACSMTKAQKKIFKKLKKASEQEAFVELVAHQQKSMGKYHAWPALYARKCRKKGAKPPLHEVA